MVYNAMKLFMEVNPQLFDECSHEYTEQQNNADAVKANRQAKWDRLTQLAESMKAANGNIARLVEIPGTVPSLKQRIPGCVFASRCTQATDLCRTVAPALEEKAPSHLAACHYAIKSQEARV